jgi:hypothetical protein
VWRSPFDGNVDSDNDDDDGNNLENPSKSGGTGRNEEQCPNKNQQMGIKMKKEDMM